MMKKEKHGKTAEISAEKDLTGNNSAVFITELNRLISDGFKRFLIDFSGVDLIDSLSLSNLIIICDQPDLEFTFRNVSGPLKMIFVTSKLENLVIFE